MYTINIFSDSGFGFLNDKSNITVIQRRENWDGITIFEDEYIFIANEKNSKIKIALLLEPRVIKNYTYDFIEKNYNLFDYIFTFDDYLINNIPNCFYYAFGTTHIERKHFFIHKKTELVNIIASNKKWTFGHKLRHSIINKFGSNINPIGRGYKPFEKKIEGMSSMFQIVVENCSVNGYFTEKIIDCFVTGTIPIYWGCKNIDNFFDINGILRFNNFSELENILNEINVDKYNEMMEYIKINFNLGLNYIDIYEQIIKNNTQINWE